MELCHMDLISGCGSNFGLCHMDLISGCIHRVVGPWPVSWRGKSDGISDRSMQPVFAVMMLGH